MLNLADVASCKEAYPKPTDDVSHLVRRAHKLVLPTETLHLVQHMRSQMPKVMNDLRRMARPCYPLMFVEADLAEYNRSVGNKPTPDQEGARTGILIVDYPETESFQLYVIDSTGALTRSCKVLNWPLRYNVTYGAGAHEMSPVGVPLKVEQLLWGYGNDIAIGQLHRTAWAEPDARVPMDLGVAALRETQGVLRYACAILALLNGPATLHAPSAPLSRNTLLFQRPRKVSTPLIIRVEVPKRVKNPGDYALKAAREGTRKRLHEVRGHYRHTTRLPLSAHGPDSRWEPCDGGWRLWIANHERGDESLGDLRGRITVPVVPHHKTQGEAP
jgi:hypothetical protein